MQNRRNGSKSPYMRQVPGAEYGCKKVLSFLDPDTDALLEVLVGVSF